MAKLTLLEMVQDIMSDMTSDEVNSITDTVEALQVAQIIKTTYFELFSNIEIPELEALVSLEGLGDTARPNYLRIPENVDKVKWVAYDSRTNDTSSYKRLDFLRPEEFADYTFSRSGVEGFTQVDGFWIGTTASPRFWTSFDDLHIVFDSYDSEVDDTLQQSKNLAYVRKAYDFTMEDDFIPHIDSNLFPLLLAEAKSVSFNHLKGEPNPKEEQRARRQRVRVQNDLWRANPKKRTGPDYSRKR